MPIRRDHDIIRRSAGRQPHWVLVVSRLVVLSQVTLADVRAHIAETGLDEDAFVERVLPALGLQPAGRDVDLIACLSSDDEALGRAFEDCEWGCLEPWQELCATLRDGGHVLADPAASTVRDRWQAFARSRRGTVLMMSLRRTLRVLLPWQPWDGRAMPDARLSGGSVESLSVALQERIIDTPGGYEFLSHDPTGGIGVLSHTMALVFSHARYAQHTVKHVARPIVRADTYERAAESMGLVEHFGAIRRVLEIDHPDYLSDLGLGLLEYRGRDHYLFLNSPRETKWLLSS